MAHGTSKPLEHTLLFVELKKELDADDFKQMKGVVKAQEFGNLKPGELQKFLSPEDLLEKLEHKGIIMVGDYRKLEEIMMRIDRKDIVDNTIGKTKRELRKKGIKVITDHSDDASKHGPVMMDTEPPQALNTNNSRRMPSFDDAMPSDVPVVSMDADETCDDRPRYKDGRGYVLFINNFVKQKKGNRGGSEKDRENLENLFDDNFHNYKFVSEEDLTMKELKEVLKKTKKKLRDGRYTRFILILCSHGRQVVVKKDNRDVVEEQFLMVDEEGITEEKLTEPFLGDELKEFKEFPKVFIIQACRAVDRRQDRADDETESEAEPDFIDHGPSSMSLPHNANVLVSYATSKGTKAWRNDQQGTWYIYHLCQAMKKFHKREHLMDMLVRVNADVARMESSDEGAKQMPCQVSTLTKHIWL